MEYSHLCIFYPSSNVKGGVFCEWIERGAWLIAPKLSRRWGRVLQVCACGYNNAFIAFTSLADPYAFLHVETSLPPRYPSTPCPHFSDTAHSETIMQFYPSTGGAAMRPGLEYGYSAAAAANHQRMNWPPALHPSAAWPYDYAAYSAAAAYPATATGASDLRSPSAYHHLSPSGLSPQHHQQQQQQQQQQGSSTDQNGATRHNIADILGGQTDNLQSEIAKTGGAGYQKSPTTSTAASMFSPTSATPEHVRSPTTPTHPHSMVYHHPGAGEVPANFYIPAALPRGLPGELTGRPIPTVPCFVLAARCS